MKRHINKTTISIAVAILVLLLSTIFIWRSCSSEPSNGSGVYRIARDPRWYPLDLGGKEINMVAFTNELFLEIARSQKFRFEFLQTGSRNVLMGLKTGIFDAVLTSDAVLSSEMPGARYEEYLLISDPIYLVGPVIMMRTGENLKKLDQKEGRIVAVPYGNTTVVEDSRRYPKLQVKIYQNMRVALDDMMKNQIDAVIMDAIPAHIATHGLYQGKAKVVTDPLSDAGLRLVAENKSQERELIEKFNKGLSELIENGTYQQLIDKWGVVNTFLETEKLEPVNGKLEYREPTTD